MNCEICSRQLVVSASFNTSTHTLKQFSAMKKQVNHLFTKWEVAESEGFEPPCPFGRQFSRLVQ